MLPLVDFFSRLQETPTTDSLPDESEDEEVDLEEGGDASPKDELQLFI